MSPACSPMEHYIQLLLRGGVKFDKHTFKGDMLLFRVSDSLRGGEDKRKRVARAADPEIPPELNIFKNAQGGSTSASTSVKRKAAASGNGETRAGEAGTGEDEDDAPMPWQRVTTKGSNVPAHVDTFQALMPKGPIPPSCKPRAERPTDIQSHGIPIRMESRDLAAIYPTGTGKRMSCLLPVVSFLGACIHNECLRLTQGRKWRIVLFSKATASTLAEKSARDRVDIIINTPLRLVAVLRADHIQLDNVRHVILDKANRMLDAEFLSQIEEVIAACTHPTIQKAVFSPTLPAGVEKVAMGMLRDPIRVVVGLGATQPYNPPVLVSVSSQPRATLFAEEHFLSSVPNERKREDAISWMRRGESWIMVSTEVIMARGMDFKGVREVINYDFLQGVQICVHRIGRTGHAGGKEKTVTYFSDQVAPFLKTIANVLLQSGSPVPEWILKLPEPSKIKWSEMGKVGRAEAVTRASWVGRQDAIRR
ncbi:P-loop containing nucleoside triphosphate hydrolase protein [Sparassis latifolia]